MFMATGTEELLNLSMVIMNTTKVIMNITVATEIGAGKQAFENILADVDLPLQIRQLVHRNYSSIHHLMGLNCTGKEMGNL
jgi:hypothetical protein